MLNQKSQLAEPRSVIRDVVLSSSVKNGATQSQNGSVFTVNIERGMGVPRDAIDPTIEFLAGYVYNTVPNVTPENNHLRLYGPKTTVTDSTATELGYNANPPTVDHYFSIDNTGIMHIWGESPTVTAWPGNVWDPWTDSVVYDGVAYEILSSVETNTVGVIDYLTITLSGTTFPVVGDFGTLTGDPVNFPLMVSRRRVTTPNSWFDVYVPKGLYQPQAFDSVVHELLTAQGAAIDFISFQPDESTLKLNIFLLNQDIQFDLTVPNAPTELLGLDAQIYSVPPGQFVAPSYLVASAVPVFNNISQFHMHCDLIRGGIGVNSRHTQVIGIVPITSSDPIGWVITYEPRRPMIQGVMHLRNTRRKEVRCWLTNEKDEAVDTSGEDWSFHIRLSYLIPPRKR